jgi:hypothetical protein
MLSTASAICLLLVGVALLYSLASVWTAALRAKNKPRRQQQAHSHSMFFGLLPPR